MTPLGGGGGGLKMPPYSTPPPKTLAHTMEEEGRGHMRFAPQILSLLLVVRRGTSHWASRPSPPHCVLERLIYQASSDRWVAQGPAVPVTARGLPETWTGVNTKKGGPGTAAAWTTQITGDSGMKLPSSRFAFNKCHLTLRKALALSPHFGGMRTCSGFGQLARPISTLAGGFGDFMAVCLPWCFSQRLTPHLDSFFFFFKNSDIYIYLGLFVT